MTRQVWTLADVRSWFVQRIPRAWFDDVRVLADREEILVLGTLRAPDAGAGGGSRGAGPEPAERGAGSTGDDAGPADESAAGRDDTEHRLQCTARIQQFRDDTRQERMVIADEAELLWGRKVSWGVRCGGFEELFTTQSVPVMTRLRMSERTVLDTLIDAGVARTRSEALAWCVRLVGRHEHDWLVELRAALERVEELRNSGPGAD